MRQFIARLAAVALALGTLASCGGDGPDYTWLRAMHVVTDAPSLRVSSDEYVFRRQVAFGASTDEGGESLISQNRPTRLTLEYFGPPNNVISGPLLTTDVPVQKDSTTTVVYTGSFDAVETVVVVSPRRSRPINTIYFQFVHAALDQGPIDVYVTDPDTPLTATAPFASLQPGAHSESLDVPFGPRRIRLTTAGTLDVIMDSGEVDFPEQTGSTGTGLEWLFAIAPSVVPGPSPLFLVGSAGRVSSTFFDAGTPATLRAIHGIRGTGPVDVAALTEPPATLINGLAFRERSPLVATESGTYEIEFRPAGQVEPAIASLEITLTAPAEIFAVLLESGDTAQVVAGDTFARSVASEARIRLAQLAPDGFVSVYLTKSADEARAPINRLFLEQRYGAVSGHLSILEENYFLTVTKRQGTTNPTGDEEVIYGPVPFDLVGGDVYTLAVFAPDNEGDPEVIEVFDDLLP
jgi:hypothetical protein